MRTTKEIINCDFCKAIIPNSMDAGMIKSNGPDRVDMDVCKECLSRLHDEIHVEYMRLIKGEVMGRRGWRKLGEIDS